MRTDDSSEYELKGTYETGVFPKGPLALTNDDKIRLLKLTGTENPEATIDRALFYGSKTPEDPDYFIPQMPEENDPEGSVANP